MFSLLNNVCMLEFMCKADRNYRINVLYNEFSNHMRVKSHILESMDEDRILDMVMIFLNQNPPYFSCWTLE